jgi:hypothetical protein
MKTLLAIVGVTGSLAFTTVAWAGNEGDGSGYGTQPGFDVASANTVCSGHGSFGAFGKSWNLGIEASPGNGNPQHALIGSFPGPGTDGTQTGLNNSAPCGNRQGNLPD